MARGDPVSCLRSTTSQSVFDLRGGLFVDDDVIILCRNNMGVIGGENDDGGGTKAKDETEIEVAMINGRTATVVAMPFRAD